MKNYLEEIRVLYSSEKCGDALRVIGEAEERGFVSPALLVWKSRCLLLTDNQTGDLTNIETILKQALNLDDEYLPAIVDLAYFYLNVMDDAHAASPMFRKALSLCTENATETVLGLAECISETDSPRLALEFLERNAEIKIDPLKLQDLKMELLSVA